jgi:hypothetical protein
MTMSDLPPARSLTAAELMRQLGFKFPTPALERTTASRAPAPRYDTPFSEGFRELRPASEPRRLHVTNGDSAAGTLRLSGISGEVSITADPLHEGPAPGGLPPERWRKVRARHLAEGGHDDYDSTLATLTRWDRALEGAGSYDEVVLWFEHDLFDQLLLIRSLDLLAGLDLGGTVLSLVQSGEYLGHLTPQEMAALLPERRRVSDDQKRLAREAWRAFCAPDPRRIEEVLAGDTSPLPYLEGALLRHLEELPAVADGLSRSERQILRALDRGAAAFEEVFRATQAMEERIYMGDASFHRILRELAASPRPLVRLEPGANGALRALRIALTPTGREVLAGQDDWVRIRGIDRWFGGVHLHGSEAAWRWDAAAGRLAAG